MDIQVYEELANKGKGAKSLANTFLQNYFKGKEKKYPIDPFKMLKDCNVKFVLRDFSKAEGIYIPSVSKNEYPVVGINLSRTIQKQRLTAAHELCHHIKDSRKNYVCVAGAEDKIEKYAEEFAVELLMPTDDFRQKVNSYVKNGKISYNDVLKVSHIFGVSFEDCLSKICFELSHHKYTKKQLHDFVSSYNVDKQKNILKLYDYSLYGQLINSISDVFGIKKNKFSCESFKSNYIYYDSRMEGVKISKTKAGDIIADLRMNKQKSEYCNENNKNIIQIAGLTAIYDYVFQDAKKEDISIYEIKHINKLLYSYAPYPDDQGNYRVTNTLVSGAKFETVDHTQIPVEIMKLGDQVDILNSKKLSTSEYIKLVADIHHRMTVIHPFPDGNGRTSRAFSNMLLLRKNIPPIFFAKEQKDEYKKALSIADKENNRSYLYEIFYKSILSSFTNLTEYIC